MMAKNWGRELPEPGRSGRGPRGRINTQTAHRCSAAASSRGILPDRNGESEPVRAEIGLKYHQFKPEFIFGSAGLAVAA